MREINILRSHLNKAKFTLGLTPKVQRDYQQQPSYIPKPYKAVCLISADFEMAWASRYTKSSTTPLEKSIADGMRTRKNIPAILDICDQFNVPITWATVGHLFLESCSEIGGIKHPDLPRLPYFENEFWRFDKGDWFDDDPCTDLSRDPAWYAPDLIKDILSRKTKHEIGCHTFSHIDCRDGLDNGTIFKSEIEKCVQIAKEWGIDLKSFVHPGHTIGNLNALSQLGFMSIRTDYGDALAMPIQLPNSLWVFQNTAELSFRSDWSIDYHVFRYKRIIDRAIRNHRLCVLWFHPSFSEVLVKCILPELFEYLQKQNDQILTTTHASYTHFLSNLGELPS